MTTLPSRPEPLDVDLAKAAVVVVDMQNAFASKGGMLDLAGVDLAPAAGVVRSIQRIVAAARACRMPVVYLQVGYKPDLSNSGGDASPNPRKELALCMMRSRPELKGKLLIEGTWDFAIVDELKPEPGDIVIVKARYSGFAGTTLESMLRVLGIRYLFFVGIATNVCVESTLRDAYFRDFWPILVTDAAMQAGPPAAHDATIFNVESFFGWTLTVEKFVECLRQPVPVGGID
jgi:ureidoacrylate peracid hydrolase